MAMSVENPKSLESVIEEIRFTRKIDALKICDLLDNNPMCIVEGPYATGKTEALIPHIEKILTGEHRYVRVMSTHAFSYFSENEIPFQISNLGKVDNGVLILDEAGDLSQRGQSFTNGVLSIIHESGFAIVPVIAYNANNPKFRNENMQLWKNAEIALSGFTPETYSVTYDLDPVLAKKLLTSKPIGRSATPFDVADFILEFCPNIPRIIMRFVGVQTKGEALTEIRNDYHNWFRLGHITKERFDEIWDQIHL